MKEDNEFAVTMTDIKPTIQAMWKPKSRTHNSIECERQEAEQEVGRQKAEHEKVESRGWTRGGL